MGRERAFHSRTEFEKGKRLTILNVSKDRIQLREGEAEDAWLEMSAAP